MTGGPDGGPRRPAVAVLGLNVPDDREYLEDADA
jgi:hypothetical protein